MSFYKCPLKKQTTKNGICFFLYMNSKDENKDGKEISGH